VTGGGKHGTEENESGKPSTEANGGGKPITDKKGGGPSNTAGTGDDKLKKKGNPKRATITKSRIKLEFEAAIAIGKQLMVLIEQGRSISELAKRPVAKKEDETPWSWAKSDIGGIDAAMESVETLEREYKDELLFTTVAKLTAKKGSEELATAYLAKLKTQMEKTFEIMSEVVGPLMHMLLARNNYKPPSKKSKTR
jgi:hypothetical protein